VVELMITPSETRDRLCEGIFRSPERGAPMGELHEVMKLTLEITPLEKKIRRGIKEGKVSAPDLHGQIDQAQAAEILTAEEAERLRDADIRIMKIIAVDDFSSEELARVVAPAKPAPRVTAPKKRSPSKTARGKPEEKDLAISG
jgi:acyl-CoA dehydrogenase